MGNIKDTHGSSKNGWIAVDLDGTLAHYDGWNGPENIGDPIPSMVSRIKKWLSDGKDVRILTARAAHSNGTGPRRQAIDAIHSWTEKHIGQKLEVTNSKDAEMLELWDDRAIQVKPNTGQRVDGLEKSMTAINELEDFAKGGPFSGPKGGKWADSKHTIPWKDGCGGKGKKDGKRTLLDEDLEDAMITKLINSSVKKSIPTDIDELSKAEAPSYDTSPNGQRQAVAKEHAARVHQLRKGESDISVGLGIAPPKQEPKQLQKGITWNQGEDSMVQYSNQSDLDASRLVKSDNFYNNGSPIMGRNPVLAANVQCPACKNTMNKSLTACPSCNHGAVVHQVIPCGKAEDSHLVKSDGRGPLRPVVKHDVFCPDGVDLGSKDDE